ncbi:MAG: hypothetical protein HOE90_06785 [Bacteriovoracaceae bacterium]|nr:hypothetical protein [Bacteriovoracaceae bacterium]
MKERFIKKLSLLLTLNLISAATFGDSGINTLPKKDRYRIRKVFKQTKPRSSSSNLKNLRRINEQNKRIEALLGLKFSRPFIGDETNSIDFKTGSVFKGILLNSIVSTNLESPILIEINPEQGFEQGAKIKCTGTTMHRRVITACSLLITTQNEFEISAVALNQDGSAGLKGMYYSGKDEFFAATVASAFAKGIVEISQDKLSTPYGELAKNTSKNKILQGAMNSIDEANTLLKEEASSKEPKVYIEAGKEVLVFLTKRFKI